MLMKRPSQPRAAYRPASPSGCECVRGRQEGERPGDIERKVSGQRLSEIYPHSEACKREDAGSWGPEIRAQTWAISTQTPVREAPAPRLRPTLTGGYKTQAWKREGGKKKTVYGQNHQRETASFCRLCGCCCTYEGDKTPSCFTPCLMAYGGSLQHHL